MNLKLVLSVMIFLLRVVFNKFRSVFNQNIVRFLPKKSYTGTELVSLVYNKSTFDIKHANKTRR